MSAQSRANEERDRALLSLGRPTILAYADKYRMRLPYREGLGFWVSVHKARTGVESLPLEERQKSKDWLTRHGFRSFDDGELR